MATKNNSDVVKKQPIAETRKENTKLREENEILKNKVWCYLCDQQKTRDHFHQSTDPRNKSGLCRICKECAKDIALRKDINGEYHDPTKESVQLALQYLDKPFLEDLWISSIDEAFNENTGKNKNNPYTAYVKNIAMYQYAGMTWRDSDMFKEHIIYEDEKTTEDVIRGREDQDTYSSFVKNKKDVKRLLGYDPFEKELLSDQPFLYSQLLGLLDASEDANDDMMRTASAISIVRGFLQQSKLDDGISKLMSDPLQLQKNSGTIKSMQDSKKSLTTIIKDLAAESCISLKNSKNAKKGENTWTGKTKKIKDMNLREAEVNGFDIATCKAMRQVMDASNASILAQLHLDESEWSDMVAELREVRVQLEDDLAQYKEISRILLRENIDLKDYMSENNILPPDFLVDITDLYSYFSDREKEEVSDDDESQFDERIGTDSELL